MNRFEHLKTQRRALAGARLALAAGLLLLLAVLVVAAGQQSANAASQRSALLPAGQRPNFVVIQTDDQTIDQLYATYTPPGGAPIPAMPNTLAADRRHGASPSTATTSPTRFAARRGSAC